MKKGALKFVFAVLVLLPICSQASEIREYILGDIDGFVYNGTGSVDDIYVDPVWLNSYQLGWPIKSFDILEPAQAILFSFRYDLTSNEQVIAAMLTLGLRSTVSGGGGGVFVTNGGFVRPSFSDLNWYPVGDTGTTICSVDLANVHGYNVLPTLQNGLFNAEVHSQVAVDYALLTLEVVPEPVSILLFIGGILFTRRLPNKI